ncbi:MAG TPA: TPM domain-containing protein [Ideonella sp.]|uniref:TPM domain-containing protein n=1 Tax=Ideonella sp. TaxID=1929293 RepID=UPI002E300F6D|nr:TPM domain-containing protein [Ideonella sp.]HEX5685049.1 TPM domain-containing protein [Ideonella sp.]
MGFRLATPSGIQVVAALARSLLLLAALCWAVPAAAQWPVPPLSGHVVDQVALLDDQHKLSLEQKLTAFEARKGSQLAVLIVRSTAPEPIEQFALRVGEQWKLGRSKVDDGAILVVAKDDQALRIEVGYGLEGALNDATAKRIISEVIVPRFQQQDFAGGIEAGVDRIIRVVDGEPLPPPPGQAVVSTDDIAGYLPVILAVAVVLGGLLRVLLGRLPGALVTGGAVAFGVFAIAGVLSLAVSAGLIALLVSLFGGWHLLGLGRGAGGRGGPGGGFRGGGGGFGGGGASGRW